jgi:hypothetical protein
MKKFLTYTLYTLLLSAVVCACSDRLDINQVYSYDLVYMPIKEKIVQNETIEIQCELLKEGNYEEAKYWIRYFQNEGKGGLKLDANTVLSPNERYLLSHDKFSLYYTSFCTEQQNFDVYIEDSFGQTVQKAFSFTNEKAPEEKPVDYSFTFTSLPVPSRILMNDTIEIKCQLIKADERNNAGYSIRYFQPIGKGTLLLENEVPLQPNELYTLDNEDFKLYYVSNCEERQTIDIFVVNSQGQTVQKSFSFENIPIVPEPEIDISFELVTLPVPKKIMQNETIEIRCQIKKADERNTSSYSIRYFQPDGKGELRMDNGTLFLPNDLYPLDRNSFRLYYTSHCAEQQTIDIYIEDEHGQVVQKTFSLQDDKIEVNDTTTDTELLEE